MRTNVGDTAAIELTRIRPSDEWGGYKASIID